MKRHRPALFMFSAVVGFALAIVGAASALEVSRPVDVIAIFAGAFGSGAALVEALRAYRNRSAEGGRPA